jgi:hypothetical protein
MDKVTRSKVRMITEINDMLTGNGQKQLCTRDFDLLYGMDIDELLFAQKEIEEQLRELKRYQTRTEA